MRDISELELRTRPTRSDGVVLGTLLQGTRGFLLIVFNWTLFIQYGWIGIVPGLDIMAALPPTIFFLIGFLDLLIVKRVWQGDLNGWRYGIVVSMLILLLTPITTLVYLALHFLSLYIIIDFLTVAVIIALVTPSARQFYHT